MQKLQYRSIKDLKKLPGNPRTIKEKDMDTLVKSIKDNPDYFEARPLILSDRTGELIILAGNQRYEAARMVGLEQVPTYLLENLTPEREQEIIIRDNISNGNWDWDQLANEWDQEQLEAWGVELPTDDRIDSLEDGEEIEFDQSVQIDPPAEYIIILAEPNSVEWEQIKETLQLKMVRRGGYKKGSAFDAVGIERVIRWDDFKERYKS